MKIDVVLQYPFCIRKKTVVWFVFCIWGRGYRKNCPKIRMKFQILGQGIGAYFLSSIIVVDGSSFLPKNTIETKKE